jgi:hypothetical protein
MSSELQRLIEKYKTVTGPTVFRLDVLSDLLLLKEAEWQHTKSAPAAKSR